MEKTSPGCCVVVTVMGEGSWGGRQGFLSPFQFQTPVVPHPSPLLKTTLKIISNIPRVFSLFTNHIEERFCFICTVALLSTSWGGGFSGPLQGSSHSRPPEIEDAGLAVDVRSASWAPVPLFGSRTPIFLGQPYSQMEPFPTTTLAPGCPIRAAQQPGSCSGWFSLGPLCLPM